PSDLDEQDEQDLSQSYEASSESIRSASYVLLKQPQELKSDLHDEVIAKLDKNIIVEQELKQQLSSPAHTST
ncbi:4803_t:CDS:2, partial [Funneliformis caledonium]